MRLPKTLAAVVAARRNRFVVDVEVAGGVGSAHLANSGRLTELLLPGAPARVTRAANPGRRTAWDLRLVACGRQWVSVDARLPPVLLAEAVAAGRVPVLSGATVRREQGLGESRIDLVARTPDGVDWWIEAKSCTLVRDQVALFPDAPTARGARHLRELARVAAAGGQAAVAFVVGRADAMVFRPHRAADVAFAQALAAAAAAGVQVWAFACQVDPTEVAITVSLPVELDG